jgi:hypothetical protein
MWRQTVYALEEMAKLVIEYEDLMRQLRAAAGSISTWSLCQLFALP